MNTILKFILTCLIAIFICGAYSALFLTKSCKKHQYNMPNQINLPKLKEQHNNSINWNKYNKNIYSEIKEANECVILYFSNQNINLFTDPSLIDILNSSFLMVKINDIETQKKFNIINTPTLILFPITGKPIKVSSINTDKDILQIISNKRFISCY